MCLVNQGESSPGMEAVDALASVGIKPLSEALLSVQ